MDSIWNNLGRVKYWHFRLLSTFFTSILRDLLCKHTEQWAKASSSPTCMTMVAITSPPPTMDKSYDGYLVLFMLM